MSWLAGVTAAIGNIGARILETGDKAGVWDIGKMLGLRPEKTTAGNDPEYIQAVAKEMRSEYDLAQKALQIVNPLDTEKVNYIITEYNNEKSLWGNPSNPNRNVADPRGFEAKMHDIINNYSSNPMDYESPLTDAFDPTQVRDVFSYFATKLDEIGQTSQAKENQFYSQTSHDKPVEQKINLNTLGIGLLLIVGLIFVARR